VEFVDELPKRHEQSSLAPLTLSPPGSGSTPVSESNAVSGAGDDRSPSPWHRLKPSVV